MKPAGHSIDESVIYIKGGQFIQMIWLMISRMAGKKRREMAEEKERKMLEMKNKGHT